MSRKIFIHSWKKNILENFEEDHGIIAHQKIKLIEVVESAVKNWKFLN